MYLTDEGEQEYVVTALYLGHTTIGHYEINAIR